PFRVVEGVEELRTELKSAAARLAEQETLEEREVPVLAARATQIVERGASERSCRRIGKSGGCEPGSNRVWIANAANLIRTVGAVRQRVADVVAGAAQKHVDGFARLQCDDSRYLPSSHGRLQQPVRGVLQERNVIDEVDEGDVRAIQTRR